MTYFRFFVENKRHAFFSRKRLENKEKSINTTQKPFDSAFLADTSLLEAFDIFLEPDMVHVMTKNEILQMQKVK